MSKLWWLNLYSQKIAFFLINNHIFYNEFIKKSAHEFDCQHFHNLTKDLFLRDSTTDVLCISEENISGDIYTGRSSKELMHRLRKCFGDPDILIVIREQVDYLLSAYSNYVLHGGSKGVSDWLYGQETNFGEILDKIHYSHLVSDYIQEFGQNKVSVIFYEDLLCNKKGLNSFLKKYHISSSMENIRKVNIGRSLLSNRVMSFLNVFGLYKVRGIQRVFKYFPGSANKDREIVKNLLKQHIFSIKKDNKRLGEILDKTLPQGYLL